MYLCVFRYASHYESVLRSQYSQLCLKNQVSVEGRGHVGVAVVKPIPEGSQYKCSSLLFDGTQLSGEELCKLHI